MKKLFINNIEVKGIGFVYDNCHKIYILEDTFTSSYSLLQFIIEFVCRYIYDKNENIVDTIYYI